PTVPSSFLPAWPVGVEVVGVVVVVAAEFEPPPQPASASAAATTRSASVGRAAVIGELLSAAEPAIREGSPHRFGLRWHRGRAADRTRSLALDGAPRGVEGGCRLQLLRDGGRRRPRRPSRPRRRRRALLAFARPRCRTFERRRPRARDDLLAR